MKSPALTLIKVFIKPIAFRNNNESNIVPNINKLCSLIYQLQKKRFICIRKAVLLQFPRKSVNFHSAQFIYKYKHIYNIYRYFPNFYFSLFKAFAKRLKMSVNVKLNAGNYDFLGNSGLSRCHPDCFFAHRVRTHHCRREPFYSEREIKVRPRPSQSQVSAQPKV